MSDAARARLAAERKLLLESKPAGCFARPCNKPDGSTDLMYWEAGITPLPGSKYALPQSGSYRLILEFKADFPASAPLVRFSPPIFHTNCFPSGSVCLSLLLAEGHHREWRWGKGAGVEWGRLPGPLTPRAHPHTSTHSHFLSLFPLHSSSVRARYCSWRWAQGLLAGHAQAQ